MLNITSYHYQPVYVNQIYFYFVRNVLIHISNTYLIESILFRNQQTIEKLIQDVTKFLLFIIIFNYLLLLD